MPDFPEFRHRSYIHLVVMLQSLRQNPTERVIDLLLFLLVKVKDDKSLVFSAHRAL